MQQEMCHFSSRLIHVNTIKYFINSAKSNEYLLIRDVTQNHK